MGRLLPPTPTVGCGLLKTPYYSYSAKKDQYLYHGPNDIANRMETLTSFSWQKIPSELIGQRILLVLERTRGLTAAMAPPLAKWTHPQQHPLANYQTECVMMPFP